MSRKYQDKQREKLRAFLADYNSSNNTTLGLGDVGLKSGYFINKATGEFLNPLGLNKGGFTGTFGNWVSPNASGVGTHLSTAGGLAIGGQAAGMLTGLLAGGNHTAAGDVINRVGDVASLVPGPYGAMVGGALKTIGGLANAAFGSNVNEKFIASKNAELGNISSLTSNATTTAGFMADALGRRSVSAFSQKDVGTDGWFANKAKKKFRELAKNAAIAELAAVTNFANAGQQVNKSQAMLSLGNLSAFGGPIEVEFMNRFLNNQEQKSMGTNNMKLPNILNTGAQDFFSSIGLLNNSYKEGGPLETNGTNFSTGLVHIRKGGTHEENPNDGVPLGVDNQGVPNLLELGEIVYTPEDYVFSMRLKTPKVKKYKNGGKKNNLLSYDEKVMNLFSDMYYADAAKKAEKITGANERPNDPISQRGLKALVGVLMESQEKARQEQALKDLLRMIQLMSPEEYAQFLQLMQLEQMAQLQMLEQQMALEQMAQQQPSEEEMQAQLAQMSPEEQQAYIAQMQQLEQALMSPQELMLMQQLMLGLQMAACGGKLRGCGGKLFWGGGTLSKKAQATLKKAGYDVGAAAIREYLEALKINFDDITEDDVVNGYIRMQNVAKKYENLGEDATEKFKEQYAADLSNAFSGNETTIDSFKMPRENAADAFAGYNTLRSATPITNWQLGNAPTEIALDKLLRSRDYSKTGYIGTDNLWHDYLAVTNNAGNTKGKLTKLSFSNFPEVKLSEELYGKQFVEDIIKDINDGNPDAINWLKELGKSSIPNGEEVNPYWDSTTNALTTGWDERFRSWALDHELGRNHMYAPYKLNGFVYTDADGIKHYYDALPDGFKKTEDADIVESLENGLTTRTLTPITLDNLAKNVGVRYKSDGTPEFVGIEDPTGLTELTGDDIKNFNKYTSNIPGLSVTTRYFNLPGQTISTATDVDAASDTEGKYDQGTPFPKIAQWPTWAALGLQGIGLGVNLYNALNPDYSNLAEVETAIKQAGRFMPVKAIPVGERMKYTPLDVAILNNAARNANLLAILNITNARNGNVGMQMAGTLGLMQNYLKGIGENIVKVDEGNFDKYYKSTAFNGEMDKFNSQIDLEAQKANQEAWYRTGQALAEANLKYGLAKEAIKDKNSDALALSFKGIGDLLGTHQLNLFNNQLLGWRMLNFGEYTPTQRSKYQG